MLYDDSGSSRLHLRPTAAAANQFPAPREKHTSVVLNQKMLVFGGRSVQVDPTSGSTSIVSYNGMLYISIYLYIYIYKSVSIGKYVLLYHAFHIW